MRPRLLPNALAKPGICRTAPLRARGVQLTLLRKVWKQRLGGPEGTLVANDLRGQLLASLQPEDVRALSDSVIEELPANRLARHMAHQIPSSRADRVAGLRWSSRVPRHEERDAREAHFRAHGPVPPGRSPGCKLWFQRSELDEWRKNSVPADPVRPTSGTALIEINASKMLP